MSNTFSLTAASVETSAVGQREFVAKYSSALDLSEDTVTLTQVYDEDENVPANPVVLTSDHLDIEVDNKPGDNNGYAIIYIKPHTDVSDSGTATAVATTNATTKMVIEAGHGESEDDYADLSVYILSGTGAGQIRTISSSTINDTDESNAHSITVDTAWTTNPSTDSVYVIGSVFYPTTYVGTWKVTVQENGESAVESDTFSFRESLKYSIAAVAASDLGIISAKDASNMSGVDNKIAVSADETYDSEVVATITVKNVTLPIQFATVTVTTAADINDTDKDKLGIHESDQAVTAYTDEDEKSVDLRVVVMGGVSSITSLQTGVQYTVDVIDNVNRRLSGATFTVDLIPAATLTFAGVSSTDGNNTGFVHSSSATKHDDDYNGSAPRRYARVDDATTGNYSQQNFMTLTVGGVNSYGDDYFSHNASTWASDDGANVLTLHTPASDPVGTGTEQTGDLTAASYSVGPSDAENNPVFTYDLMKLMYNNIANVADEVHNAMFLDNAAGDADAVTGVYMGAFKAARFSGASVNSSDVVNSSSADAAGHAALGEKAATASSIECGLSLVDISTMKIELVDNGTHLVWDKGSATSYSSGWGSNHSLTAGSFSAYSAFDETTALSGDVGDFENSVSETISTVEHVYTAYHDVTKSSMNCICIQQLSVEGVDEADSVNSPSDLQSYETVNSEADATHFSVYMPSKSSPYTVLSTNGYSDVDRSVLTDNATKLDLWSRSQLAYRDDATDTVMIGGILSSVDSLTLGVKPSSSVSSQFYEQTVSSMSGDDVVLSAGATVDYDGYHMVVTEGPGSGQVRLVSSSTAANATIVLASALETAVTSDSTVMFTKVAVPAYIEQLTADSSYQSVHAAGTTNAGSEQMAFVGSTDVANGLVDVFTKDVPIQVVEYEPTIHFGTANKSLDSGSSSAASIAFYRTLVMTGSGESQLDQPAARTTTAEYLADTNTFEVFTGSSTVVAVTSLEDVFGATSLNTLAGHPQLADNNDQGIADLGDSDFEVQIVKMSGESEMTTSSWLVADDNSDPFVTVDSATNPTSLSIDLKKLKDHENANADTALLDNNPETVFKARFRFSAHGSHSAHNNHVNTIGLSTFWEADQILEDSTGTVIEMLFSYQEIEALTLNLYTPYSSVDYMNTTDALTVTNSGTTEVVTDALDVARSSSILHFQDIAQNNSFTSTTNSSSGVAGEEDWVKHTCVFTGTATGQVLRDASDVVYKYSNLLVESNDSDYLASIAYGNTSGTDQGASDGLHLTQGLFLNNVRASTSTVDDYVTGSYVPQINGSEDAFVQILAQTPANVSAQVSINPATTPATTDEMANAFYMFCQRVTMITESGTTMVRPIGLSHGGTIASGGVNNVTLQTTATATADFYVGQYIYITSGPGVGEMKTITGYTSGRVLTVDSDFTATLTNTSTFEIGATPFAGGLDSVTNSTTIELASGDSPSDTQHFYNGQQVQVVGGTGIGQTRTIDTYDDAGTLTVSSAFSPALDTTSKVLIGCEMRMGDILSAGTESTALENAFQQPKNSSFAYTVALNPFVLSTADLLNDSGDYSGTGRTLDYNMNFILNNDGDDRIAQVPLKVQSGGEIQSVTLTPNTTLSCHESFAYDISINKSGISSDNVIYRLVYDGSAVASQSASTSRYKKISHDGSTVVGVNYGADTSLEKMMKNLKSGTYSLQVMGGTTNATMTRSDAATIFANADSDNLFSATSAERVTSTDFGSIPYSDIGTYNDGGIRTSLNAARTHVFRLRGIGWETGTGDVDSQDATDDADFGDLSTEAQNVVLWKKVNVVHPTSGESFIYKASQL